MVYNALSYRQWRMAPRHTLRRLIRPSLEWANAEEYLRAAYDTNEQGQAAPSTVFVSRREIAAFLGRMFRSVKVTSRNIGEDFLGSRSWARSAKNALVAPFVGLDLYIDCVK